MPPAAALLTWYDRHRRILPWRAGPGETADPYHVWLSEIMLSQTSVAAVVPYFQRFLTLFPTIAALASAPLESVLHAWAGLGYYARARNLHACAQAVVALGGFPQTVEGLRALPGIGAYAAPAIAAIAFGVPVLPVDGNVERVTARLFAIDAPLPGGARRIVAAAAELAAQPDARARPSDFTQAMFDLGATICTPRRPACALCPWRGACTAQAMGIAETLPMKTPRAPRPERHGVLFRLEDSSGQVLLARRPPSGLLGGMTELPGTPWREAPWPAEAWTGFAPIAADWTLRGSVRHVFTHFALTLEVRAAKCAQVPPAALVGRHLLPAGSLDQAALPTLMRKALSLG